MFAYQLENSSWSSGCLFKLHLLSYKHIVHIWTHSPTAICIYKFLLSPDDDDGFGSDAFLFSDSHLKWCRLFNLLLALRRLFCPDLLQRQRVREPTSIVRRVAIALGTRLTIGT